MIDERRQHDREQSRADRPVAMRAKAGKQKNRKTGNRTPDRHCLRISCFPAFLLSCFLAVPALAIGGNNPVAERGPTVRNERPPELAAAGIDDHTGVQLPLDLTFTDSAGKTVKLGDYFADGKPVLLNLVYFNCPMLCTLALNATVDSIKQIEWTPGSEYRIISVSINPEEGPDLAAEKKANYIGALGKDGAAAGWAFLTGDQVNIKKLADAVGFRYAWVESEQQYSHAAGLFVFTPTGKLSRVMGGLLYDPQAVRLSMVEATGGKIGTFADVLIMLCGRYNPHTGTYQQDAILLMKYGGAVFLACFAAALLALWRWDRYKRHLRESPNSDAQPNPA